MTDHSNLTSAGVLPHWVLDNMMPSATNPGGKAYTAADVARMADLYGVDDLWTTPGPDATQGPSRDTFQTNLQLYLFPNSPVKYLHFSQQLPHAYQRSSPLLWHVHFRNKSTIADGEQVTFTLDYSIGSPYTRMDSERTANTTFTNNALSRSILSKLDPGAVSGTTIQVGCHLLTTSVALTLPSTGVYGSAAVIGRISRSVSDSHAGDVQFMFGDNHIRYNRLGSATEDPRT